MTISPAVKAVMAKLNKKHGEGTILLGSEIVGLDHPTITTGSLSFDVALGGGWAVNHFIEIVGHRSNGKTAVMLKTIAANQRLNKDFLTLWIASEDFHEPYASMLGVDLDRVIVLNENVMETAFNVIIEFLETRGVDCIVIDSLPALIPEREDDKDMEDFQVGLAPLLINKFFRKANPYVKRSLFDASQRPITVFLINQWRNKIGSYGDPNTTPGGMGKDFFCFQQIEIRRVETLKNTKDEPIGQRLRLVNRKNKFARPGRIGEIDFYFARGNQFQAGDYDVIADLVSAGKAYKVIKQSGGGYYSFGEDRWRGEPQMVAGFKENRALQRQLRVAVMAASALPPEERDDDTTTPSVRASRARRSSKAPSPTAQGKRERQSPPRPARRNNAVRVQDRVQGKSANNTEGRRTRTTAVQRSNRGQERRRTG